MNTAVNKAPLPQPGMVESPLSVLMYLFFPGGGIGRYTHELATAMHALPDIQLELACLPDFHYREHAAYPVWPKLQSIASSNSILRRIRFLTAQAVSPRRAIRRARQLNAEILHLANINHLTFPLWHRWLKRTQIRVVATAHDVRRGKKIISRRWEERALRGFYETADALFVHSNQQRDDLHSFADVSDDRIHLVPMGTMPYADPTQTRGQAREKFGVPEAREAALFFGNIRDDKNLDGLLTAMSQLDEPPFLIIAGSAGGKGNSGEAHYRQKIAALELEDDVLFLHRFIENEEVGDLFNMSDYSVLPYCVGFTSQSAVLNVSAHYRKPVLVTPAPTLAETVRQHSIGLVCESDRSEDIAAGIVSLRHLVRAGHIFDFDTYHKMNSWQENARVTRDVYLSLLRPTLGERK